MYDFIFIVCVYYIFYAALSFLSIFVTLYILDYIFYFCLAVGIYMYCLLRYMTRMIVGGYVMHFIVLGSCGLLPRSAMSVAVIFGFRAPPLPTYPHALCTGRLVMGSASDSTPSLNFVCYHCFGPALPHCLWMGSDQAASRCTPLDFLCIQLTCGI